MLKWSLRDALYRGDSKDAVCVPDPTARLSFVEHILYLGGYGRPTPFTSVTEREEAARRFAGKRGRVWNTNVPTTRSQGAKHHSRDRLLRDLRGHGRGIAKWTSAWEVAQARANVLRWSEHLLDWSEVDANDIDARVKAAFKR
jgi:hypothetical protein